VSADRLDSAAAVARAAGAAMHHGPGDRPAPEGATCDSRQAAPGLLFVGLPGRRADGGEFAPAALAAGAWGVMVEARHARAAVAAAAPDQVVLAAADPLRALQRLARARVGALAAAGARVVAITGSTGKTSTKDILAALLGASGVRVYASPQNLNTEIGLPLAVLGAPAGVEVLVLEMAMRGEGQIAELAAIARPDVGAITNVGPVHLELLGTVERIARAKAELLGALAPGSGAVVPADEPLLRPYLRSDLRTVMVGPGGDVSVVTSGDGYLELQLPWGRLSLAVAYDEPHNLANTACAVACALALGILPRGRVEPRFSRLRGETLERDGVRFILDCYNANPMSMRAALDNLARQEAQRRIAVLGTMAELGERTAELHREVGRTAAERGVDVLVCVGKEAREYAHGFVGEAHLCSSPEEARALLARLVRPGDVVLLKASRAVGLERAIGL